ncbi:3-phosphoshikimate 1-carboxyvinyltransferase [Streptomyces sp. NPDC005728]|uniref:3-phosphoshikimate 1-carboxyvinyltransferase n=1 Tax=Streptomyces sp. NPDC005728 TaxID=3157054 RepID=UPI0033F5E376
MSEVRVPGSKSLTARALFVAASAAGTSTVHRPLRSDDTEAFVDGLRQLGYGVETADDRWTVHGRHPASGTGAKAAVSPAAGPTDVYCRDAATAARFLPALAALGGSTVRFDASAQLRRRPLGPVVDALRALGADLAYEGTAGHLPLTVRGGGLRGGTLRLDAGLSSQFLTALLLAGPLLDSRLTVQVTDLVSVPYVDMTLALMRRFGARATREGDTFTVLPEPYRAGEYTVEPDASTASYFLAAAAVTGRSVTVPGLGTGSLQGDVEFARVLERMGARVRLDADRVTVTGPDRLRGLTVAMRDISDTMPTLAAIAPFADAPVLITDVYNTRVKECDRLDACAENLRRLGVPVETGRDWIRVHPAPPGAALVDCRGDHRIAMSFSITGLRVPGLSLDDPGCVKKTFPGFHDALDDLRRQWGDTSHRSG